jgi:hypothetical protein
MAGERFAILTYVQICPWVPDSEPGCDRKQSSTRSAVNLYLVLVERKHSLPSHSLSKKWQQTFCSLTSPPPFLGPFLLTHGESGMSSLFKILSALIYFTLNR